MFIEYPLIIVSLLLLGSILASKVSDRFGVPSLVLFLALGMLAGSDGLGGFYFDDPALAQFIGVVALTLILFSGGLDTHWSSVRPVLASGVALSTLGVFVTALIVGVFAKFVLNLSMLEGLLLVAIVSSTDAAAVFSILRAKGINLKGNLRPLLELESGSNDPMAVFLTVGLIQLLTVPDTTLPGLILSFGLQFLIGAITGLGIGRGIVLLVNRLRLGYEGLYPVLTLALVFLTYGVTNIIGGNGFLAVYVAGIMVGNQDFIHKRSLLRFHDGLAWLMQIAMFLTLGLLVFPSRLVPVIVPGLIIAAGIMFVARPVSVFLGLALSKFAAREKAFASWVGLRGAVPIVLATYPLLAGLPQADLIFNVIFFVVLTSVLLQGSSVHLAAKLLRVDAPVIPKRIYPIEYNPVSGFRSELKELTISPRSDVAGRPIVELGLPDSFLVILIAREGEFLVPSGGTVLLVGDTLIALSDEAGFEQVQARISRGVENPA